MLRLLVCEVAESLFSADSLSLPTSEVAFFAAASLNATKNSSPHSSRQSQASTSRDSPVPPPGRFWSLLLLLLLLAPIPLSVVLLPLPSLPPSPRLVSWSKARPSAPWLSLPLLLSDVVAEPEKGKAATLLDLELLTLTEAEVADLSPSLPWTYWGKAAACEADASAEPRVSSALTDDNDDLVDLVTEVDEDSVATFSDVPLRREEDVLAPTLAKAAFAPR